VWQLPAGLKAPPVPADNPMSTAKVELGAALFSDGRLSVTGAYSCSSCHVPALAFTDGRKTAVGATGELHTRNTPTLLNCAYATSFGWADPSVTTLEAQHRVPMDNHHPVELGLDRVLPERLAELNADQHVSALQHAAFGDANAALNLDQMVQALASYVRTLISADSAFDRYLYWDEALPAPAQRGMRLFFSERVNCVLCHASFNLSGPTRQQGIPAAEPVFHNTGLYNVNGSGAYPDNGLMAHTEKPADMGAFRAPTLRNVAVTAPYMHDGSIATLPEVIDFYAAGGRNIENGPFAGDGRLNPFKRKEIHALDLSAQDKTDLVAFLETLTDSRYRQTHE
jgi:cytochrome c peroxidase